MLTQISNFLDNLITIGGLDDWWSGKVQMNYIAGYDNTSCLIDDLPVATTAAYHSAANTEKGVIVCGGGILRGTTNKCYRLISSTSSWTPYYELINPRSYFSMHNINGQLIVIGGNKALRSMESINVANGTKWSNNWSG